MGSASLTADKMGHVYMEWDETGGEVAVHRETTDDRCVVDDIFEVRCAAYPFRTFVSPFLSRREFV